jgi:dihydropteroate synthase
MRDTVFYSKKTLKLKGQIVDLTQPKIMGILNVTPDSFYDGGKYLSQTKLLSQAEKMLKEGATILDIGGYSTRPNAVEVPEAEEIKRVSSSISAICKHFPTALISVDTFRSAVAVAAIGEGAALINDISGGYLDEKMFETVAKLQVPYILMHTRGTPQTMTSLTDYDNILIDLLTYFHQKVAALRSFGIEDVVLDIGFGFAKTKEQNFELLKKLELFKLVGLPLLVGISRKSMIYNTLEISPEEALNGTTALNMLALLNGASLLRVHDVKEALQTIRLLGAYTNSSALTKL